MTFQHWVDTENFKYKEDFDQVPAELKPKHLDTLVGAKSWTVTDTQQGRVSLVWHHRTFWLLSSNCAMPHKRNYSFDKCGGIAGAWEAAKTAIQWCEE